MIIQMHTQTTTKDIYNISIRVLELLNVLLASIDKHDSKIPYALAKEVEENCFELAAQMLSYSDEKEEIERLDDDYNPYPAGM